MTIVKRCLSILASAGIFFGLCASADAQSWLGKAKPGYVLGTPLGGNEGTPRPYTVPQITGWTLNGNTSNLATVSGSLTNGHYLSVDGNGNIIDGGSACCTSGNVASAAQYSIGIYPNAGSNAMVGGLTSSNNGVPYWDGSGVLHAGQLPGANLAPNAAATNLGFTPLSPSNNLSDLGNIVTSRTNLGLGALATLNNATSSVGGLYGVTPNQIPYGGGGAAPPNFISAVNNAVVATNGSGVPSEVTTLPSGLTAPSFTTTGTLTTSGVSSQVGLSTTPGNLWLFNLTDTWAGGTNFADPFVVTATMASGGTGQRESITAQFFTGYGGSGNNYLPLQTIAELCGSGVDSGRSSFCAAQRGGGTGHIFGLSSSVQIDAGSGSSDNDAELAGYESDVAVRSSGTVARKTGIQIISVGNDLYHATNSSLDDAILIDGGGVGFNNGIFFGALSPHQGVSSGGTLFATSSGTYQNGIYLTNATILSNAFASNGFLVDGSGHLFATLPNSSGTNPVCWTSSTKEFSFSTSCSASDERMKAFDGPLIDPLGQLVALSRESHFGRFHGIGAEGLLRFGASEQIGLGAQTLARYFPELARKNADGVWSADYEKLTVPIIGAIGEMQAENANRDAAIYSIERKIARLEARDK